MDFNEARDDGVAVASAEPHTNHLHLAPNRQPRQYPIIIFNRPDDLPDDQPIVSKHWRHTAAIMSTSIPCIISVMR